jgi:2,3-bisphosphoglycerate-independent phosphoglycerate mutase
MMKYVIVHGDGMADWACPELGGKTPLQAARKPNMDRLAACGELGLVATIPAGMPPGSDVGTMTMLGYDPRRYHTGRAPIEAASMGLDIGPDDVVFRMNLVTLNPAADGSTVMGDFTAGHISSEEAAEIVDDIKRSLADNEFEFHNGVSYRHIMVWHGGPADTTLTPPHDITDRPVAEYLPKGAGGERLRDLMAKAAYILARHRVNEARRAGGKPAASSVWFWGQGKRPAVPTLRQRFGASGAVISAVDLVNGLGRLAGLDVINVPGATGFLDTDYAAKGRYAIEALRERDFLLVHVEAPDEAAHMGRPDLKVEAIERIDELVLGALLEGLPKIGPYRILLMPDHATPCKLKTHSNESVPFAMVSGETLEQPPSVIRRYTEEDAAASGLVVGDGYGLIERLFQRPSA